MSESELVVVVTFSEGEERVIAPLVLERTLVPSAHVPPLNCRTITSSGSWTFTFCSNTPEPVSPRIKFVAHDIVVLLHHEHFRNIELSNQ